jgi:hypothetical protein
MNGPRPPDDAVGDVNEQNREKLLVCFTPYKPDNQTVGGGSCAGLDKNLFPVRILAVRRGCR